MKLSKAQQEVMEKAKREVDQARELDYPEWLRATSKSIRADAIDRLIAEGYLKEYWEAHRRGEVLTHCNSKTLKKLEEYGLIEIIEDSNGQNYGIDTIKVLNY